MFGLSTLPTAEMSLWQQCMQTQHETKVLIDTFVLA